MPKKHIEIERKFRLRRAPEQVENMTGIHIRQGWVTRGVRVRSANGKLTMCAKSPGDLSRKEFEVKLPGWVFDDMWSHTHHRRLSKTRYKIRDRCYTLEIDQYYGELEGLWTMEVEFDNEEQARAFTLPDWLSDAEEVTYDPKYRNAVLARRGLPWKTWDVEASCEVPEGLDVEEWLEQVAEDVYEFASENPHNILADCTIGSRDRTGYLAITVDRDKHPSLSKTLALVRSELAQHFDGPDWQVREDEP
jgi:adenylate cyclase